MENIVPVVDAALKKAFPENTPTESLAKLDAIAFTQAPGLIGSLLVGAQFAKSLALSLDKPLIAVHHMQAHVLANLIDDPKPSFPFLCLTVSGGHTQIVLCESATQMNVLGETIDDAQRRPATAPHLAQHSPVVLGIGQPYRNHLLAALHPAAQYTELHGLPSGICTSASGSSSLGSSNRPIFLVTTLLRESCCFRRRLTRGVSWPMRHLRRVFQ